VGHLGRVNAVAFVGGYVVTGGEEGTVRRWAASDGTPAEPMAGHSGPMLAADVICSSHNRPRLAR
jgi:hypothetical protein